METVNEFLQTLASKGIKLSAESGQLHCYAPNCVLTGDLRKAIGQHKAELLALLDRRERPQEFPLAAGQKGLYILQKINPAMTAYNLPLCIKLGGPVDIALLETAWSRVLDQYPVLSAKIVDRDGTLTHSVDEQCRTSIRQESVAFTDRADLVAFLRRRVKQPFDIDRGPLARIELFTLGEQERVLLITIHHMIFDGVSAVVLLRSLIANYQALSDGKPLPASAAAGYHDFVAWEEAMLASDEGRAHADYWREQLSGDLPSLELFPDRPRQASPSFEGASVVETLPADVSQKIREFAKANSVLPSVVFLAAFKLLLHRYSGLDDLIVGMPVNVRPGQKFTAEVGYFINMVPLRTRLGAGLTLRQLLRSVQSTMLEAIKHSSFPFELMKDQLRSTQGTKNAVFQVNYAYQNFISDSSFASLSPQRAVDVQNMTEIGPEGYSDLGLEIFDKNAQFNVHVRYNPDLYGEESIRRFAAHYAALLQSLTGNAELPLHEYSMLPEAERRQLLAGFNDTQASFPSEKCIHDFFAEQVALRPEQTAVSYDGQSLTYAQLNEKTTALATWLQSHGVKPDSIVGLCLERSIEMMIGIMGTVQAGGAYLPLDPDYPDDRLTYMLQDSNAAVVLTQAKFLARVQSLVAPGTTVLCLDTEWQRVAEAPLAELRREVGPTNVCYVIYTSGSTGKPKGALVEHRALVNRIHWMQKAYQLDGRDVVLQKTPYSFDVSVWEFFWPMFAGATVVFAAPDGHKDVHYLESLIAQAGVTTLHFVPSMLRAFLETARTACTSVRQIFASGEALDKQSVDRYRTSFPNAVLHNLYGPTEAAIDVTYFDCSQLAYPFVPIGKPIDNIQLYILDAKNQPQPIGVPGELHIAGVGLARGYLNRPELTQEKFVANPFEPGTRMYRTGDLACWMEDGNIQYLGRIDTQVKIRGFRVEIGEIEARLNQFEGVQDAAVIAKGEGADKQLIAFYRAAETLSNDEIRAHLLRVLPEYMVPSAFVKVEAIPLSSNGKVDRRALGRLDVTIASGREYVAPRNETEKQLVAIWSEVLNVAAETIGVHDSFFELGGHSLRAAQLLSKIRRELNAEVPLQAFFGQASVAELARFIATAEHRADSQVRPGPVDRAQFDRLPLSFAQERLWFINELEPESAGYNLPGAVVIHGALDVDQLESAFNRVIERHENLRTVFPSQDGQARQQILDRVDFQIERIDVSGQKEEAARICRADAALPFDLANGPLLRGKIIKTAADEHLLMLNMHHIVSDGWSIGVLVKEIGAIMNGAELPALPIQYADYAIWQRRWLEESGALEQQLAYWQQKLAGVPESLDLPTDYARPSVQSFAGARQAFALDARQTARLKQLAEQQGGTLFMALLAAFKVLLHRYTGQSDLCVGSPIANRQYETEGLIGMFVNTLALRSRVEGTDTFAALLDRVKATCLEAYEHQDAPFEKVVDAVRPQRNMAISPIFQTMLILQNVDMGTPDRRIERYSLDSGISKFDLTFELTETADGLAGSIEYSTALYKAETIARMAGHFIGLCDAIAAAPAARIQDLQYLGAAEQHLLAAYNDTAADYPKDRCIHQLFVEQVAGDGRKTAVTFGGETLTYWQLYDRSHELALYLQSQGIGPDSIVGLCVERSIEMMAGIMGTVLAGGAYMPLDPDYPDDRLTYMLQDSKAAVVLTQEKFAARIGELAGSGTKVVALDTQWAEVLKAQYRELRRDVQPHNLAYVIYTSGSTGRPKGVLNEHRALVNRLNWMQKSYPLSQADVVLQKTPYSFDVSVWEFFWPMMTGASVVFAAPGGHKDVAYLETLIDDAQVTTLHYVPSMLNSFLENAAGACTSVRQIFASGEALEKKAVDRYPTTFPNAVLHNLYGPTEAAIDVTSFDCSTLDYPFVPIGKPIDNIRIHILDANNQLQPIGVPGELHIAGDGLARGYLNRPELTEEKFVVNPFVPGARMYKTGDLARWMDDGNIQYLGRIDTQVKLRGFRIELGEIEARLSQHPQVQNAAVIARNQQLIAFYTGEETNELREHLQQTLPEYMIPSAFVRLEAIPLSSNGKVDRRALASLDVTLSSGREFVAPRNETERQLVAIWSEVLNVAAGKIGVNDNFFELGGHSLLATQLVSKVRRQLDVELPLKALFERSSVAQLAEAVVATERRADSPVRPGRVARPERLPLSFAQERLWFINQLEPESAGYNVPGAVIIKGELDVDALERAFRTIIERHESLRTVFPTEEGQPQQRILDRVDFRLQRIDVSGPDAEARAKRLCQADATTPFDLAAGPLLRAKVIRLAEREHVLFVNLHHIVSDGWSIGVLVRELSAILSGQTLAPLPIQYADYAVWQREWLQEGGVLDQQLGYWQQKLAGIPESLDLPTDFPRPSVQSFAGATQTFTVDAQLTAALRKLADEQGGTLYMALLAAFNVLLHRYTGQSDLCVGSPIANRNFGETEGLIGMFVNTLALRSHVTGDDSFAALLSQVKATCLAAYEHQDAPFEKVVDAVRPQRNMAISPIFQTMLILQNADLGALADSRIQRLPLDMGISKFDLTLELTETASGLAGSIEYSTALYKPQTIARLAEHFLGLCRAVAAAPAAKIADLQYLSESEQRQLSGYNATEADYAKDRRIHDFFVEQVALQPDAVAVTFDGQSLTYQELYDRSRALALRLQSQGVGPDTIVGLCLERSIELMVAILGTVLAGGAYMPLDPDYPDDRLTYMLQDSHAPVVLTQQKWASRIAALHNTTIVALDVETLDVPSAELRDDVQPHNLCYVIYTSGSTGRPKGVLNEHRSLVNRLNWMQKSYPLSQADVVLQKTPYSFDVSVWEFFWPMITGASIVFAAPGGHKDVAYLETLINDAKVTTLHYVPSMLNSFLENAAGECSSVRQIFASGEALEKKAVDRYPTTFPNAVLHNLYGPTEAAIDVTSFDCSTLDYPFVPIGKPIDNIQIHILDANNQLQPIGVPGELHIAGDGLARGYLNRPELTEEKFVANPFVPGTRMYKTGDLARWMDDGNIQYLGRIDTQVKLRGFRIELGEIEARLSQHPQVQNAAVIARNQQLIAFYTGEETTDLREHVQQTLPEYMVPSAFVRLEAIPLSSNGKVDRRTLAQLDVTLGSSREYVAPRNETERQLAAIWSEVLKVGEETIGVNDSFFELGGHSLASVQLLAKINKQFGQRLPLSTLFTASTIDALASVIAGQPVRTSGNVTPIFALPGAGGDVLPLRPLVDAFGDEQPLYAIEGGAFASVEETALAYIQVIKAQQPNGPYKLLGHSYGGVVAFEIARILEDVASLILIDSIHPSLITLSDEITYLLDVCEDVLRHYDIDVRIDVERLVQSSDEENARYLAGLLIAHGIDVDAEQLAAFMNVARANRHCYGSYRPAALPRAIDVTLYRATQNKDAADLPADYGWNQAVKTPLRIVDVDADHHSILKRVRPAAASLA